MRLRSRHSLFSQRLDRAVFASYFVGGIAPVPGFAWVVHRYVLPYHAPDGLAFASWVGASVSLGVLSLAVLLALRVITSRALSRMTAESRRRSVLLAASRELAGESPAETTLGRVASHVGGLVPSAALAVEGCRSSSS